ncbi:MAG: EamA family transporter [Acidobacteria bacterium]|nr:EamA family transporter [Acidobacteriota bacterium]
MSKKQIYLALGLGIICISASGILVKILEIRQLPLLGVATYRMFFAALILSLPALALKREEITKLKLKDIVSLILAGLFLALHFGTWTLSVAYIPVARSVLLVTCHPIFTALASRLVFKEKFSLRNLIAIMIAFSGIIVILSESIGDLARVKSSLKGDLLALSGAITIVGYIILGKKLRSKMGVVSYAGSVYTICTAFLLPTALIVGASPSIFSNSDYLVLIGLAIIPTIGGHTVFNLLLKDVSATLISVAFLGEPLGAALLAWLIFGEIPTLVTFIGGGFVLAGIYFVQLNPPSKNILPKENN